jgi:hypothetical protein
VQIVLLTGVASECDVSAAPPGFAAVIDQLLYVDHNVFAAALSADQLKRLLDVVLITHHTLLLTSIDLDALTKSSNPLIVQPMA